MVCLDSARPGVILALPRLDLYGHLYPGEMDRYADRLDSAASDPGEAKIRPDDEDDDPDGGDSAR